MSNATVPTMPIIDPTTQARNEALAAVREPRIEPTITEREAVAECHADLWRGLMEEPPNGCDVEPFGRLVNGRTPRPRGGPVEE